MRSLLGAARRYPIVAATILVALLGLLLGLAGAPGAVRWLFGGFGLIVAGIEAVGMARALRRGSIGIDFLAITAILATVLVGEYVATLIIVLMLSGGAALEDYALTRATRELDALLKRAPQIAHLVNGRGDVKDVPARGFTMVTFNTTFILAQGLREIIAAKG